MSPSLRLCFSLFVHISSNCLSEKSVGVHACPCFTKQHGISFVHSYERGLVGGVCSGQEEPPPTVLTIRQLSILLAIDDTSAEQIRPLHVTRASVHKVSSSLLFFSLVLLFSVQPLQDPMENNFVRSTVHLPPPLTLTIHTLHVLTVSPSSQSLHINS